MTYDYETHAGSLTYEYSVYYDGKTYSSNGIIISNLEKSSRILGERKLSRCLFDTWSGLGGEVYMGFSIGMEYRKAISSSTGAGIFVGNYYLIKIS